MALDAPEVSDSNLVEIVMGIEPPRNAPNYVKEIADGGSPVLEDPDLGFVTTLAQNVTS